MKTNKIFHSSSVQHVGQRLSETRYRAPWSDRTNYSIIIIKYDIRHVWQTRWVGMLPPPGNILTLHLDFKVEFMLHLFSIKSLIFKSDSSSTLSENWLCNFTSLAVFRQPGNLFCQMSSTNLWRPCCSQCVFLSWHAVIGWFGRAGAITARVWACTLSFRDHFIRFWVNLSFCPNPNAIRTTFQRRYFDNGLLLDTRGPCDFVRVLQFQIRVMGGTWVLPIKWHTPSPLLSWPDVPAARYADMPPFFPLLVLLFTCDMVLLDLEP